MLENTVWKMSSEEVSDPITADDGSVSIIKLVGISSANKKPLSEIKYEITEILRKKNMELEYTLHKDEAFFLSISLVIHFLFSILTTNCDSDNIIIKQSLNCLYKKEDQRC